MASSGMEFSIKVDNIKDLIKEKDASVEKALVSCGLIMERYAAEKCPVQTGRLRNSVVYATTEHKGKGNSYSGARASDEDMALHGTPEAATVYVGTNVEYAPYVEYGSSGRNPKPFLKPAVQDHLDEYKDVIENTLKK